MPTTFMSLYSGCGGLDMGFVKAGFTPVWANDHDRFAVETYNMAIPGGHAVHGPIEDQPLPLVPVDLVIGGPPCQGFSQAGRMDPGDPRSRHVWRFLDIVRRMSPMAFVMENVWNLGEGSRWKGAREGLMESAEAMGYQTRLCVLDAAEHGTAQHRLRMFLVGSLPPLPAFIAPSSQPGPLISSGSALARLPKWGGDGNDTLCDAKVVPAKRPVLRKSPYAGMLFNGQGRPLDLRRPSPTLPASMGGNRTPIVDQDWLDGKDGSWVERYHSSLRDGEAPLSEAPARLRRLTLEEASALQGFPRGMEFAGPVSARFRQVGNAVPPPLAFAVAVAAKEMLGS